MPTVIEEALEYAALGWHLLPGSAKKPFLKWSEASCDPEQVTKFFEQYPLAEILVLCGPSRLAVLDVDIYKAPITERLPQYDTWVAETPRGGRQYLFADPESAVPTTAGKINEWTDTRGVGGLVVLPSVNSPKRKWVKRPVMASWPSDLPNIGKPMTVAADHADDVADWKAVNTLGERLPNERCPGPSHANGDRVPSLGMFRLPDGRLSPKCFAGCDTGEVIDLLVSQGRYALGDFTLSLDNTVVTSATTFITRDELMAIQPPVWLNEPYIQENALIMLAAKFNTGKTFVAVNWALHLASEGRRVLYVALEGLTGLQSRVRAWEEYYEQSAGPNILFSPRGYTLNLLSDRSVSGLAGDIQSEGGFDLVVVDNLGEALAGDENDSEVVGKAMYSLNLIRSASGGAVLDLHNSGHGGSVRARGHSKMLDVHDTVIYLEAIEGSNHGLKVISGKERNAGRFKSRKAILTPQGDSLVAVMGAHATASLNPYYQAVQLGYSTVEAIMKYLDKSQQTVSDGLKKLVESNDLTVMTMGKKNVYSDAWMSPPEDTGNRSTTGNPDH